MFFGFPNPSRRRLIRAGFPIKRTVGVSPACSGKRAGCPRSHGLAIFRHARAPGPAFTILELLVAMTVLSLIVVVLVGVTGKMASLWRSSGSKIEQFRESRRAFESITRRISTATLAPYLDYEYPGGDTTKPPTRYVRKSDLRFLSAPVSQIASGFAAAPANSHAIFFQAPLGFVDDRTDFGGLEHLLNTWGYFVDYTGITNPSDSSTTKYRFRLMEMREPSENLSIYRLTRGNNSYADREWLSIPAGVAANRRVLADNVIALILRPSLSAADDLTGSLLSPNYLYDSTATSAAASSNPKNQLPPLIEVIMVVIDEQSAAQVCTGATAPDLGVSGPRFQSVSNLTTNLADLEKDLVAKRLNYQIFRTTLALPGARWSTQQTN
ncbi:MAG: Verru_Chthon cassette protein C [Terrimicrobiaceae bacterium]